jgi:hypothetical protein
MVGISKKEPRNPQEIVADCRLGHRGWRLGHRAVCRALKTRTGRRGGIAHCTHHEGNMNGSNNLPETDAGPMHLCPVCLRKLHHAIGFDPAARESPPRDSGCINCPASSKADFVGERCSAEEWLPASRGLRLCS